MKQFNPVSEELWLQELWLHLRCHSLHLYTCAQIT